ncbi:hypothetical protein EDS67_14625 [candidate division KSB1 bacterium]|nr:MAG: hypothetical protein EDS67_14625 [candidate division KSB1 bacterium]MCE7940993.1 hypothetical protein [Chlorobi bacterium CHB1]
MKDSEPLFCLLCQGRWLPRQVRINFQDHFHVLPPPHAERAEAFWQELAATSGNHFYNGELFRLEKFSASPEFLEMSLTRTCYRDQLYNNAHLQEMGEAAATRGLGVSAIVITSDGYTPIIRRSLHLGEAPGMLDVIGGHAHPNLHVRAGKPDLFAAIADEVTAELGLKPEDVKVECCSGLIEHPITLKPDIIFLTRITCTMAQLEQLVKHASEAEEFTELLAVRVSAVAEFMAAHRTELTPPALGCLTILALS